MATHDLIPPHQRRSSLWLLLASLVLLQFGYPITSYGTAWIVVYLLLYGGVIAYSARAMAANPRRYWPVVVASVLLMGAGTWFAMQEDSPPAQIAMLSAIGLLQLSLLVTLLARLIRRPGHSTTVDLLLVAMCAYLLMGGVFGVATALLELAHPGSFIDNSNPALGVSWQTLFYGSYVTLATLGYGDIVPVTDWARSLSSFEAVLGTLFVAVVIARLVGVAGLPDRDRTQADAQP